MADQHIEDGRRDCARRRNLWRVLSLMFVVLGVVLRGWQYYGDSAMWLDEIAVVQNVERKSIVPLVSTELDYAVAPAGFLVVQKVVTTILGTDDYAWRLWPFVASLAALFLFARVAWTNLSEIEATVGIALFALATPLVWQASQCKQYSSDVLATVVIVWMTRILSTPRPPSFNALAASAALGVGLIALSHPTVFVLAATSIWLLIQAWRNRWFTDRRLFTALFSVLSVWLTAALVSIWHAASIISPEYAPILQLYWGIGFPPRSLSPVVQSEWLAGRMVAFFGSGTPNAGGFSRLEYGQLGAAAAAVLVMFGMVVWCRRRQWLGALVVLSTGITLVAAGLRQYPFEDRLLLFLLPLFIVAIGAAIGAIQSIPWRRAPYLAGVSAAIVLVIASRPYAAIGWPTYHVTPQVKPVLEFMLAHRQPTDEVFILGVQSNVLGYYLERIDLAPAGFVVGACYNDPRGDRYLEELTPFRGTPRLWVLFSGEHRSLRELLVRFLDAAGQRRDEFGLDQVSLTSSDVIRVEAVLYDLSDAARFDAARGTGVRQGVRAGPSQEIGCPPMSLAPGRH